MTTCRFYLDEIIGMDQYQIFIMFDVTHVFIHIFAKYILTQVCIELILAILAKTKYFLENTWKFLEIPLRNIKGGVFFGYYASENYNTDLLIGYETLTTRVTPRRILKCLKCCTGSRLWLMS